MTRLKPRLGDRKLSNLRDRDVRKTIAILLSGKMIGITLLLGGMKLFGTLLDSPAGAAPMQAVAHKANDFV